MIPRLLYLGEGDGGAPEEPRPLPLLFLGIVKMDPDLEGVESRRRVGDVGLEEQEKGSNGKERRAVQSYAAFPWRRRQSSVSLA